MISFSDNAVVLEKGARSYSCNSYNNQVLRLDRLMWQFASRFMLANKNQNNFN